MKVLLASIPMTGHFNPILVAARILKESGHETAIYTSIIFRDKIEKTGIHFIPLPEDADQGVRDLIASFLTKHKVTAGLEDILKVFQGIFVDPMISQYRGLQSTLKEFPADVVIHETCFTGVIPMLLDPSSERPASVYLGVIPLRLERADGAPWGPGLLPTEDPEKRKEYAEAARSVGETKELPLRRAANELLAEIGVPPLPTFLFRSVAVLADLILQPCIPSFEFPLREPEERLHFIGGLLPNGAGDVPVEIKKAKKAGRKIVLVSQGTIANNDLGKLLAPTIQGLGDREDLLILATTGGKPIENIPCELTANTIASKFLDFSKILPDADVLVAFGGYGTVTQTLSFGVPMVVAGMSEDKPEVSARVTWTGTGIYLPTDTPRPEQVRDAVDQILAKPEYRARAMEMAREFAAYDSAKKLPELLEALVTERQVRGHGVPDGFPADCRSLSDAASRGGCSRPSCHSRGRRIGR
jgi:UDP:flavonoid glycosyltransferase YjiC (YdhE family)